MTKEYSFSPSNVKFFCILFYVVALILVLKGFDTMFRYGVYDSNLQTGDSTGHIVGGDAYNYIIIGIRGLGFMVSGAVSAVIGAGFHISGMFTMKKLPTKDIGSVDQEVTM